MTFIKYRQDDRHPLKYLVPYGYMRRHLAKSYGFKVEGGEFVKRRITTSDITGFHFIDIFPLGLVMAMQRCTVASQCQVDDYANKLAELSQCIVAMRQDFETHRERTEREIERLSVECMRLQLHDRHVESD